MGRRLALCFDGTWNTPEDRSNVSRLHAAIADADSDCLDQLKFYDAGVGTTARSRLAGGAFGLGLDRNILEGYCWLVRTWRPGDDIFLFGFSRGAFTARSLGGLLNRCGVLRREQLALRAGATVTPDHPLVRTAWAQYRTRFPAGVSGRDRTASFRAANAHDVTIKFIGVWDTVGALGIPRFRLALVPLARQRYAFHDTALGTIVENACHAVAIDEHRKDYDVTLWEATARPEQHVEQRWFPGAHANVGGGYEDDLLADIPLRWIAEQASRYGLRYTDAWRVPDAGGTPGARGAQELPDDFALRGNEHLAPARDSFGEFMYGLYRAAKLFRRHYRPIQVRGVGESIDASARQKWSACPEYRPRNLAYAGRPEIDLMREGLEEKTP